MITTISVQELNKKYKLDQSNSNFLIIDVREPIEYAHEHIPNSINLPLKQLASKDLTSYKDKTAIFHCKSGNRTKLNEHVLKSTPFEKKYCIEGGIEAWKASGFNTEKSSAAPIDIMRQVQLVVSFMILSGLALAQFVSLYFLALPLVAGLGLMIAGLTGFCGMATLLSFAPWNKNSVKKCSQLC